MTILCAECILQADQITSKEPKEAEAIIEGTALCRGHATSRMRVVAEGRRDPANASFMEAVRNNPSTTTGD